MVPEPPPEKGMNDLQRLSGVVFDPKPAFADIAARPRWWTPLLFIMGTALLLSYCLSQRIGWEGLMRQQLENNSRIQQLAPEQRERIIEQQMKFIPIAAYAGPIVTVPVSGLVIAAILLVIFKVMLGGDLTFKQLFAIGLHAWIPNALATLLIIIVLFAKAPEDFNIRNPLMFNAGAYLPSDAPQWMKNLGSSIDLFSIWVMLLLATGISAADRKLPWVKCFTWIVLCWLLWVFGKMAFSAVFG